MSADKKSVEVVIQHARDAVAEAQDDDGWVLIRAEMLSTLLDRLKHEPPSTETPDRSIEAVIARLRFGDSDGDDHDIAANELERFKQALAAQTIVTLQAQHERDAVVETLAAARQLLEEWMLASDDFDMNDWVLRVRNMLEDSNPFNSQGTRG